MPLLLAAIAGLLKTITFGLVLQTVLRLGLGVLTFVGIIEFVEYARDRIFIAYGQLPTDILTFLSILQVDTALGLIMSALVFRATLGFGSRVTFNRPSE